MTTKDVYSKIEDNSQLEQALHDSQARLTGIIESAMDAIITANDLLDPVLQQSRRKMFGYSAKNVIGQPVSGLIPERFHARHHEHIHRFGEMGVTNRTMGSWAPCMDGGQR
jgi:PAS domain S-box-containing protein